MSKHLLLTKYDISPANHERWSGIMARFIESFPGPVIIGGDFVGAGAGPDGRPTVGHVVRVEQLGEDLWGDVVWIGEPPPATKHIKMNWSFGPGPDRVSLSSGFLDHWPHRSSARKEEDVDEDAELDDPDLDDIRCEDWGAM